MCVVVDPFASSRLSPAFRNLTSHRRPDHFGLGVGPFLFQGHHWYTNARYHHTPSPHHLTAYKLEVGNRGGVRVDGTNSSKYAERDRFLDGMGEILSSLRVNGAGSGGDGLDERLISLYHFGTVNAGNTHTNVSTSLDIRSSTVPTRDPCGRMGEKFFRALA